MNKNTERVSLSLLIFCIQLHHNDKDFDNIAKNTSLKYINQPNDKN